MADTSERIITLSAILLVVVIVLSTQIVQMNPAKEKEDSILTVKDMQILIATSRDNYTLGEGFTATVYLVNNRSEEVQMEPITSLTIEGKGVNETIGSGTGVDWMYVAGTTTHLPANAKRKLADKYFTPEQTGEFIITCLGANKTVNILEKENAWITATILTVEPSPNLDIVELSSEDKDIPRSLFKAIDKALPEDESVKEGGHIRDLDDGQRKFPASIAEAESIIRYFGEEMEKDRLYYEYYVSYVDSIFSILIQFHLPDPTS